MVVKSAYCVDVATRSGNTRVGLPGVAFDLLSSMDMDYFGSFARRSLLKCLMGNQLAALIISTWVAFPLVAWADKVYYVDADWSGAQSGTANQPWASLNWPSINTSLNSGNVTIYFSAREATSLVDDKYDTAGNGVQRYVDLSQRTSASSFLLTLDGKSFYNANDAAPVWIANTGTNMCVVQQLVSQNNNHAKKSNITIHGFRIVCNVESKQISVCGDNFTVEYCEGYHLFNGPGGVGLLIVPTADGSHEGSGDWCPACTNIVVRYNIIHDTQGEALYIGGGGTNPGQAGSGYPSHSSITISSNEVYSAGIFGGQGDGIDIKGGLKDVLISGNNIHALSSPNGVRAIVAQGQMNGSKGTQLTIERNFIHDNLTISDAVIALADSWGVPQGVIIRNNVLANNTGGPARGIHVYSAQDQILVQNNTIYRCKDVAIDNGGGVSLLLRNNLFLNNNSNGSQVSFTGGTTDSDYNAHNFAWSFGSEGAHTITMSAAEVTAALVNPANGDFHLKAGGALIGVGQIQSRYTNDFDGVSRPSSGVWDIGAYRFPATRPSAPTNLRVSP
jgi:Right handed beta helix region